MPHIVIEAPAELMTSGQARELIDQLRRALVASGEFEAADIKIRVMHSSAHDVGSGGAFVHLTLLMLDGRTIEKRRALAEACLETLVDQLGRQAPIEITVDVREIVRETYVKRILPLREGAPDPNRFKRPLP